MPRVIRRGGVGAAALAALLALATASPASAEAPAGPRLAFGVWGIDEKPMETRLDGVGPKGFKRQALAGNGRIWPVPFDGGSWAPDGSAIAFAGSPRGNES